MSHKTLICSFCQSLQVRILIQAGADVNIPSKESHTPVYVAAQNGHVGTVYALINEGHADVNKPHTNGATPLFIAAQVSEE